MKYIILKNICRAPKFLAYPIRLILFANMVVPYFMNVNLPYYLPDLKNLTWNIAYHEYDYTWFSNKTKRWSR